MTGKRDDGCTLWAGFLTRPLLKARRPVSLISPLDFSRGCCFNIDVLTEKLADHIFAAKPPGRHFLP
ncbi:hypothetical protein V22_00720 [Calycomorphotria hydatis]|uniref:Uncharacterized protein n=1 Tax=Calycomorphotria hydatis TaxID=2528027 RepID=A0A517T3B7_9PLAN|nr:hypothetical protein V22_00720 [Calycomorphotria hydatis]